MSRKASPRSRARFDEQARTELVQHARRCLDPRAVEDFEGALDDYYFSIGKESRLQWGLFECATRYAIARERARTAPRVAEVIRDLRDIQQGAESLIGRLRSASDYGLGWLDRQVQDHFPGLFKTCGRETRMMSLDGQMGSLLFAGRGRMDAADPVIFRELEALSRSAQLAVEAFQELALRGDRGDVGNRNAATLHDHVYAQPVLGLFFFAGLALKRRGLTLRRLRRICEIIHEWASGEKVSGRSWGARDERRARLYLRQMAEDGT